MKNNFIISGLAPGFGGVPRFLEYLGDENYLVCPKKDISRIKIKFVMKIVMLLDWLVRIALLRTNRVVLMHHNSIPFVVFIFIFIRFRHVEYFAIDNSFFCSKSYNFRNGTLCLECLGSNLSKAKEFDCVSFPRRKMLVKLQVENFLIARTVSNNTTYTLSETNSTLLQQHFRNVSNVKVIGFNTHELMTEIIDRKSLPLSTRVIEKKQLVFHGSLSDAKGVVFCIDLARHLPEFKFLFPFKLDGLGLIPVNCSGTDMSWSDGLGELVRTSECVLCPSLWSYTPEAAMLKSFIWSDNVFFINVENSFGMEIPSNVGIHGTGDVLTDAALLRSHFDGSREAGSSKGLTFVESFVQKYENNDSDLQ